MQIYYYVYITCICEYCVDERYLYLLSFPLKLPYTDCIIIILTYTVKQNIVQR